MEILDIVKIYSYNAPADYIALILSDLRINFSISQRRSG